jgi:hypothetical protein
MRSIPDMITGLRALAGLEVLRYHHGTALLNDAANYIEGATENLRQQTEQLTAMRVLLEQVRPLMEEAADELEEHAFDITLPRLIRDTLRWWEPVTAGPASISHWGVIE